MDGIIKKANQRLKFLYRHKSCLSLLSRKSLCNALIQCHIDYACTSWYESLSVKLKKKLQVVQNKVIRFILDLSPRSSINAEVFEKLDYLNISNRVKQLRLNHVFNIFHEKCPDYLNNNFSRTCSSRSTRSSKFNFFLPRVEKMESETFYFNGIRDWNSLPDEIKCINNKISFKSAVKKHLLADMKKTADCDFLYH